MVTSIIRKAFLIISALVAVSAVAQNPVQYLWGDQGNGTYINPVLNADGGMAMFDDFEYPIQNR